MSFAGITARRLPNGIAIEIASVCVERVLTELQLAWTDLSEKLDENPPDAETAEHATEGLEILRTLGEVIDDARRMQ